MHSFLSLFGLFFLLSNSLALSLPTKLWASSEGDQEIPFLVVSGTTILKSGNYGFVGIEVQPEGNLIIEPGVSIYLMPESSVRVKGRIEARGSPEQPIIFSTLPGLFWRGLFVEPEAREAIFQQVIFIAFDEGIFIRTTHLEVSGITLRDGRRNRLVIGMVESEFDQLILADITFLNLEAGVKMEETLLQLYGTFREVKAYRITFSGERDPPFPRGYIGVQLKGSYHYLLFENLTFPGGCRSQVGEFIPGQYFELIPRLNNCTVQPYPVVFVPGFGASLNLSVLTGKPNPETATSFGWGFSRFLTPTYFQFIDQLEKGKIPYAIAYYDWRLPAAEAEKLYLRPVIQALKQKYSSPKVQIVTHSFGGLVARSYIQSQAYQGDVDYLIQVAPPNQGTVKAYTPWIGAELPPDWEGVENLLRFYTYRYAPGSRIDVVHQFFPSLQDLQTSYPALKREGIFLDPENISAPNHWLLSLNKSANILAQRVKLIIIGSKNQDTQEEILLSSVKELPWLDGRPYPSQPIPTGNGDGTVPLKSFSIPSLPKTQFWELNASHLDMLGKASYRIITTLFGARENIVNLPDSFYRPRPYYWVAFDCPIEVSIQLPDGSILDSNDLNPGTNPAGESWYSPDMIWMLLPKQEGKYRILIRALEDTPVRFWVNNQPIQAFFLQKDEEYRTDFPISSLPPSSPSPSLFGVIPSPAPSPSSAPSPSPSSSPSSSPTPSSSPSMNPPTEKIAKPSPFYQPFTEGISLVANNTLGEGISLGEKITRLRSLAASTLYAILPFLPHFLSWKNIVSSRNDGGIQPGTSPSPSVPSASLPEKTGNHARLPFLSLGLSFISLCGIVSVIKVCDD